MKNLEENWKSLLDDEQEIADSNYEFDKEKIWNKINKKQTKHIVFAPWITHAAAALTGILLTTFLFLFNKKQVNEVVVKQETVKQKIVVDTVFVEKKTEIAQVQPSQMNNQKVASNQQLEKQNTSSNKYRQVINANSKETIVSNQEEITKKEEEVAIPTKLVENAKPTAVKVIHLADIESGNVQYTKPNFVDKLLDSRFAAADQLSSQKFTDIFKPFTK